MGAKLRSTLKQCVSTEHISQSTSQKCCWDATQGERLAWFVLPGILSSVLQRYIFNYLVSVYDTLYGWKAP